MPFFVSLCQTPTFLLSSLLPCVQFTCLYSYAQIVTACQAQEEEEESLQSKPCWSVECAVFSCSNDDKCRSRRPDTANTVDNSCSGYGDTAEK